MAEIHLPAPNRLFKQTGPFLIDAKESLTTEEDILPIRRLVRSRCLVRRQVPAGEIDDGSNFRILPQTRQGPCRPPGSRVKRLGRRYLAGSE